MLTVPHDDDLERAVLGAMVLTHDALDEAATKLRQDDFFSQRHGRVFVELVQMRANGDVVELIAASRRLVVAGIVDDPLWLREVVNEVTTPLAQPGWVEQLRDLGHRRRLMTLAVGVEDAAANALEDPLLPIGVLIDEAVEAPTMQAVTLHDAGDAALDRAEQRQEDVRAGRVVRTGFQQIDRYVSGLGPGSLMLVAARPGIGKSTLVQNVLLHVAERHHRSSVLFSMEMDAAEIGMRVVCQLTETPHDLVMAGRVDNPGWRQIVDGMELLREIPMRIIDRPNLTPTEIRTWVRRLRGLEPAVVAVDYVGLMRMGRRVESRQQEVADISRSLKELARENHVCVIGVVQLNRQIERRAEKTPQLSDLRESGALEADADVVLMLWRDKDEPGTVFVEIAKNRNGETGQAVLRFDGRYFRFRDARVI